MSAWRLAPGAALMALLAWPSVAIANPTFAVNEAVAKRSERDAFGLTFDSTAWLTVELSWARRLGVRPAGTQLFAGAGLSLPVLLWAQTGSLDSVRASGRVTWLPIVARAFHLAFDLETGLATQHSVMGTWVGIDAQLTAFPSVSFKHGSFGALFACRQGISTYVHHSDYVRAAFEDRYPAGVTGGVTGPRDGFIAFPFRRYLVGLAGAVHVHQRWSLSLSTGLAFTVHAYTAGAADTMAVGQWPFFASLGVVFRL